MFPKNPKLDTQQEDEEESLSLIDLPLNLSQNQPKSGKTKPISNDFDFNLYSVSNKPEMCAADDVFFNGKMLPYRHSVSSDTGLSLLQSMDHNSPCGVISSRSSSINSQYSSSSGSVSTTNQIQRTHNYFHSPPSPLPQIRTRTRIRYGNASNYHRKSNLWGFFRVGLVKTPGIELRDIKNRTTNNCGSRNSTSSNSSSQTRLNKIGDEKNIDKKKRNNFFDFGGCKCSVNVINPVNCDEREKGTKIEDQSRRKSVSSRYRTFEWIKELSIECAPDKV